MSVVRGMTLGSFDIIQKEDWMLKLCSQSSLHGVIIDFDLYSMVRQRLQRENGFHNFVQYCLQNPSLLAFTCWNYDNSCLRVLLSV